MAVKKFAYNKAMNQRALADLRREVSVMVYVFFLTFKDLPAPYNRGSRCDFLRHFFICFCSARIVHFFLLVNTYARFIVFASQNLRRAYARFIDIVKNGCAATG